MPQEAGIKTIPKKKKCEKAKRLSEEALQIAEKRREVKGKGEKERYTHLNAELQRIAGRGKKAFLSDQCREIEEINRMGKTRDLFKKNSDIKGKFHVNISWQIDGETMEMVTDFIFLGPKSLQVVTAAMKLKTLLLGSKVLTNRDSIFKSRDIPLPTKVCLVKGIIFQ